ncbi:unnamed protein product [Urochloa humidicola]
MQGCRGRYPSPPALPALTPSSFPRARTRALPFPRDLAPTPSPRSSSLSFPRAGTASLLRPGRFAPLLPSSPLCAAPLLTLPHPASTLQVAVTVETDLQVAVTMVKNMQVDASEENENRPKARPTCRMPPARNPPRVVPSTTSSRSSMGPRHRLGEPSFVVALAAGRPSSSRDCTAGLTLTLLRRDSTRVRSSSPMLARLMSAS